VTAARRLFDLANRGLDRLGFLAGEPAADRLIRRSDPPDTLAAIRAWRVEEALSAWTRALREEAALAASGRLAARLEARRAIATLGRLHAAEAADPSILDEPIPAPIFITGMPRSGTTFLHRLLALDPANRVPSCWETLLPYPPRRGRDRRRQRVEREFRAFLRLAPELSSLHPLAADLPQECTAITALVFRSLRYDTTHRVPGYRAWLDASAHGEAYRFHRRFLQHLQRAGGGPRRRWVLKSPDHLFALDAIRAVYPDARLVVVHRDPLRVLPSVARLTEVLRAPFTRALDPAEIGRQVSRDWLDGARRMIALGASWPADRVLHLHHADVTDRPVGTVERLYDFLGCDVPDDARSRIATFLSRHPRGGYGANSYRLADHGLDPATERRRFADYVETFAVRCEQAA